MMETLEILAETQVAGVLHSFSGNLSEAERTMELGFFIGITGPVTFKNATELRQVVSKVPLDQLLIETDGPFLTPHPHRGQRNEPAYVRFVAEKISEIHKQPFEVVAETTSANARQLFQWSI
jgi:TatD DNase family protein